ncbi:MAG: hypothetical protein QXN93_07205 [Methanomassiliicoccales archaeon]
MPESSLSLADKSRPAILISAILIGLLVGFQFQQISAIADPIIYFTLIILIYSVVLNIPFKHVLNSYRNLRFFSFAWFQNFVIIPLLGFMLALIFLGAYPAIFVGFILYIVTPCTDWFLMFTQMARGDVPLGVALLPTNLILQILLLPVYLLLFAGKLIPIQIEAFIEALLVFVITPMALAGMTRYAMKRLKGEERGREIISKISTPLQMATLVIIIFFMFSGQTKVIVDNAGPLALVFAPLVIFFFLSFLIAQLIAKYTNMNYGERALLTCTTAARNSPLGLAIAVGMFPDEPLIQVAIIIGVLIELPILVAVVKGLDVIRNRITVPS